MNGSHRRWLFPDRWVGFYPSRWRSGIIWSVVCFVDIRNGDLAFPVVKPPKDFFGGDLAAVAKQIGIVEETKDIIRYLLLVG